MVELDCPRLVGDGEGQVPEGVESHRSVGADGALEAGLELPDEHVYDLAVVKAKVSFPRFHRFSVIAEKEGRFM